MHEMIRFYNRKFPCNLFGKVHGYLDRDDLKKNDVFLWLGLFSQLSGLTEDIETLKSIVWCNKLQY